MINKIFSLSQNIRASLIQFGQIQPKSERELCEDLTRSRKIEGSISSPIPT